jgi:hypothetical protein
MKKSTVALQGIAALLSGFQDVLLTPALHIPLA